MVSGNVDRDQDITNQEVFKNVRLGLGYVPEDRRIFSDLTVQENFEVSFNAAAETFCGISKTCLTPFRCWINLEIVKGED